jgi:hypothetical protein
MPLLSLSVKHDRTVEEAQALLERAVREVCSKFGSLIQKVDWAANRQAVQLGGPGFEVEMRVDAQDVHVTGDFPFLSNLLGGPLKEGLKGIVQQTFQKRLT